MFDLLTYVFVTACALPTLTRGASLPSRSLAAPKAIYYMINEGPNAIASIPVAKDGTLTTPISTTLTGGQSGAQIDAKTGGLASPDALGSAGSLQVIGQVWQPTILCSSSSRFGIRNSYMCCFQNLTLKPRIFLPSIPVRIQSQCSALIDAMPRS